MCRGSGHGGPRTGSPGATRESILDKVAIFFKKPAVRSILLRALVIGLTMSNPAAGYAANLALSGYNYAGTAKELWNWYQEWKNGKKEKAKQSLRAVAEDVAGYETSEYADEGAEYMVEKAEGSGMINQVSEAIGVGKPAIREMLKGTISQAISDKFAQFAGFVVTRL